MKVTRTATPRRPSWDKVRDLASEATGRPAYTRYNPDSPEGAREIYIPKEIGGVQLTEKEQKDLREGRPVTTDFINELIRGYSERHNGTPHGRIPPNLLWSDNRKGGEKYIWYNPPRKRMMFFKESLNMEDAEYNMPGIIYEIKEERMNIYAYIDKESSSYFNPMAVLYWKY